MLARVTSGQNGIVEYLKDGVKNGRELGRDELDHRVCIDGNIAITDNLIKEMNQEGRKENYLHITLSFGERDLKEDKIVEAYRDYKKAVMSAYSVDEYNVYAEIHYPKVKSYVDKKTGDLVERFPHIHMVLPEKNLVTDKALNPFGRYSSNIKFHDAIQETVNRKHQLESPYDNQRKYKMTDQSEFISRYKGDNFKGSNSELKNELFELIGNKNIRSMDGFKKELAKYGEVSTGKAGATDEYLLLKLPDATKNIRLKETCFKVNYIEDRELLRAKPSDQEISKNLNNWVDNRSHEMKHIHSASPKTRKEYYALTKEQQKEFLHDRRNDFTRRYDRNNGRTTGSRADNIRQGGREANRELGTSRNRRGEFTDITNGLPSMPERGLVRADSKQSEASESILPSNEYNHLEQRKSNRNNELRWSTGGSGRTRGLKEGEGNKPNSLSEQLLIEQKTKTSPKDLQHFREIRKKLDPVRVLNHFEKSHGLIKSNYETVLAKDGSSRIKIGDKAYNVSDFCTQHMRQDWQDVKEILTTEYKKQLKEEKKKIDLSVIGLKKFSQLNSGLPQQNLFTQKQKKGREDRQEKYELNSIVFVSSYVTQGKANKTVLQKLNHSVRTLKHLQKQERYGEITMGLSNLKKSEVDSSINKISSPEIDLKSITDNFKRQQEVIRKLSLKMGDLVPAKYLDSGKVDFNDKNTGLSVFQDQGNHVVMTDKKPTIEHVAVAMTFAAEKFGKVAINGTKDFKQQVIDVAVAKNLNIVFADQKMQEQFIKDRDTFKSNQINENTITNSDKSKQVFTPKSAANDEKIKPPLTLVSHGAAPYQNEKGNANSYFVKTSDGKTAWGVGLSDAVEKSNVNVGDEIKINRKGSEKVEVNVDVKDKQGNVVSTEKKMVDRVEWEITKPETNELKKEIKVKNDAEVITKSNDTVKEVKTLNVAYNWSEKDKKMEVTINGKSPKEIPEKVMMNIKNNDKFLNSYSLENIRDGKLDLAVAENQPVPKKYDMQGVPQQWQEDKQAPKQTQ